MYEHLCDRKATEESFLFKITCFKGIVPVRNKCDRGRLDVLNENTHGPDAYLILRIADLPLPKYWIKY